MNSHQPVDGIDPLFEYAPISLWEEDFSAIYATLNTLRLQGIVDFRLYLQSHPEMVDDCMRQICIRHVNRRTLDLYEAATMDEMVANIDQLFRDEMRVHFSDELQYFWNGVYQFEVDGINYSLSGRKIPIHLHSTVLPGHENTWDRVLIAIEDITPRLEAERAVNQSEAHFRSLFEDAPVSLWELDYSEIQRYLTNLRGAGIENFHLFLVENPEVLDEYIRKIRVINVNQRTLDLFKAGSKGELLASLSKVFGAEIRRPFMRELQDLWDGWPIHKTDGVIRNLQDEAVHVTVHFTLLPGYESSMERVLVAMEDITARRKAEDYLKYLGIHDVLTGLYNRAFFEEERNRMEMGRHFPISLMICDVDDLKAINNTYGHQAGDELLRRTAEVLRACFRSDDILARIGGDEFGVLLPETDIFTAEGLLQRVRALVEMNNKTYQGPALSISLGTATGERTDRLQTVQRDADDRMIKDKRLRKLLQNTKI